MNISNEKIFSLNKETDLDFGSFQVFGVPAFHGELLLNKGKASVYRRYPFTIILKREVEEIDSQPFRLKIDPGSKTTGMAILNDRTGEVVWAAELQHRGWQIKSNLDSRHAIRRSRRNRKTRYRKPRFNNSIRARKSTDV